MSNLIFNPEVFVTEILTPEESVVEFLELEYIFMYTFPLLTGVNSSQPPEG